jgi:flavin reductase (DIM6/NTAB) family NADH-FMN oxidoreductase RutF
MIEAGALRQAFGRYMTGVTVVTGLGPDNTPVGFTANSFTSVSLDPPMLLVCPGRHLSSFEIFAKTDHFAVNILAEGQEQVSNLFARSVPDRFDNVNWTADAHGCPLIEGRSAGFSCKVTDRVPAGDHMILIGHITAFDDADRRGLGYCSSGYFSLGNERQADAPAQGADSCARVILEHDGHVVMTKDGNLPEVHLSAGLGARTALRGYLEQSGMDVRLGPVYAIYTQPDGTRLTVLRGQVNGPLMGPFTEIPVSDLGNRDGPDAAEADMLRRFAQEYRDQSFGLYVGDASHGEIHLMDEI